MAVDKSYLARLSSDEPTAHRVMNAVAEVLDPEGIAAAVFAQPGGRWAVELHFTRQPDAGHLRDLVGRVAGQSAARALTIATVAPRDWVAASLTELKPVGAGRFVIHGRHDRARVAPNRIAVEVEAALAFGTGHHGTTRGCLSALDALVKRQRKRPRILDLGTGSGVLAIAAAKAFRAPVLASDIDRTAVNAARENARLNCAAAWVSVVHAASVTSPQVRAHAPYDVVFANILLGPLKKLAAPLARLLAPNARVVLSGLLPPQANAAMASYYAHGLVLERRIELDGWATLVMTRPIR